MAMLVRSLGVWGLIGFVMLWGGLGVDYAIGIPYGRALNVLCALGAIMIALRGLRRAQTTTLKNLFKWELAVGATILVVSALLPVLYYLPHR
jgi:hypothetical protein